MSTARHSIMLNDESFDVLKDRIYLYCITNNVQPFKNFELLDMSKIREESNNKVFVRKKKCFFPAHLVGPQIKLTDVDSMHFVNRITTRPTAPLHNHQHLTGNPKKPKELI